jgi:uncharacterized protein
MTKTAYTFKPLRPLTLALFFGLIPAVVPLAARADVSAPLALLQKGDVVGAAKGFQAAFDKGDGDGAFYLGRMLELGIGAAQNLNQAAKLYEAGTQKGSILAETRLGQLYLQGTGVVKDYQRGTELVCKAAAAGNADAEVACGQSLFTGTGIAKDPAKARDMWEKAVAQHNIAALNALGKSWLDDASPDAARALGYFDKAAGSGDAMALFEAARLLRDGTAGKADPVKAYAYANLAASVGYPDAASLRDAIEKTLTRDQVTEGQKMAADFKPAAPDQAAGARKK